MIYHLPENAIGYVYILEEKICKESYLSNGQREILSFPPPFKFLTFMAHNRGEIAIKMTQYVPF